MYLSQPHFPNPSFTTLYTCSKHRLQRNLGVPSISQCEKDQECVHLTQEATSLELTRVLKNPCRGQAAVCLLQSYQGESLGFNTAMFPPPSQKPSSLCSMCGADLCATWTDLSLSVASVTEHSLTVCNFQLKHRASFPLYRRSYSLGWVG